MFKHILIPTDGSKTASKAVRQGVKLAQKLGAKVTGYYAVEPLQAAVYGDGYMIGSRASQAAEARARRVGQQFVAEIGKAARAAGVPFQQLITTADTPYRGIVAAAKQRKCDAIFMASHGRSGLAELIMGSVTQKVLAHSKIPVLVYR
jgi:nucleotide-binding universal stress UspA family protein